MASISTEGVLEFLRAQISAHRAIQPRLQTGALMFAVTSEHDGFTDWWTLYIRPSEVWVTSGPAPSQYLGPTTTVYASTKNLASITEGADRKSTRLNSSH